MTTPSPNPPAKLGSDSTNMTVAKLESSSIYRTIKSLVMVGLLALLITFCWLMAKIVLEYIPFTNESAFLILKQGWVKYDWWLWAFKIHVFTSILVMFAGFSQFWGKFGSARYRQIHRYLGYFYVVAVFSLALPSGFVLAWTALGGWIVKTSFLLLCLLWGVTTYMGVKAARQRQFAKHRMWMIYSYALALSAVTLRFLKLILYAITPYVDGLTPMVIYRTESVLAWIINLVLAWLWLRWTAKATTPLAHPAHPSL